MTRLFKSSLIFILLVASAISYAVEQETTSNPAHRGYIPGLNLSEINPVGWNDRKPRCPACQELTDAYNRVVSNLLKARYQLAKQKFMVEEIERDLRLQSRVINQSNKGDQLRDREEILGSHNMNEMMFKSTLEQEVIPNLKSLIATLEQAEASLRAQLESCENQCAPGEEGGKDIRIGTPAEATSLLPFLWEGPYPAVCFKCEKLAARLNELPGIASSISGQLQASRAEKVLAESELTWIRAGISKIATTEDSLAKYRKRIQELEEQVKQLSSEIARHEGNLAKINSNFGETLKLYEECVATCLKKTSCVVPNEKAIRIGPNGTYGTGAKVKEKVSGFAAGLLGNVLGGSGISLGGGGDDSDTSAKGPDTVPDPTSGAFRRFVSAHPGQEHSAGVEVGGRFLLVDDKLISSVKLENAPSDGTFHSVWIQDGSGKIILPTRYMIISIYQDWELNIWWTHDRWVNGEHVLHEEGEEFTTGTANLGNFYQKLTGEEGVKNSIWYAHGFNSAVKGINHLAAVFPASATISMDSPCPSYLVTHVTLPSEDPVTTAPLMLKISLDP